MPQSLRFILHDAIIIIIIIIIVIIITTIKRTGEAKTTFDFNEIIRLTKFISQKCKTFTINFGGVNRIKRKLK